MVWHRWTAVQQELRDQKGGRPFRGGETESGASGQGRPLLGSLAQGLHARARGADERQPGAQDPPSSRGHDAAAGGIRRRGSDAAQDHHEGHRAVQGPATRGGIGRFFGKRGGARVAAHLRLGDSPGLLAPGPEPVSGPSHAPRGSQAAFVCQPRRVRANLRDCFQYALAISAGGAVYDRAPLPRGDESACGGMSISSPASST